MKTLQQWQGYVTEVGEGVFWADLVDVTAGGKYAEESAEIPLSNLLESEREYAVPGFVFDWRIVQEDDGATRSEIVFKKEKWTAEEIADADRRARELNEALKLAKE